MRASDRHPRADVLSAVLDILESNPPMTRADIVGALMRRGWKERAGTLTRHVRRAIGWLQVAGFPVGTWGRCFVKFKHPHQRQMVAKVLVSQAAWLMFRALRLTSVGTAEVMFAEALKRLERDYPRDVARNRVQN